MSLCRQIEADLYCQDIPEDGRYIIWYTKRDCQLALSVTVLRNLMVYIPVLTRSQPSIFHVNFLFRKYFVPQTEVTFIQTDPILISTSGRNFICTNRPYLILYLNLSKGHCFKIFYQMYIT
jgi:hypothetical protein